MTNGLILFVEGSIGSGKSSLVPRLAQEFQLRVFQEPVDLAYLNKFYRDPKGLAFEFQLRQLACREVLHHAAQSEAMLRTDYQGAILDRSLLGDRVFASLHQLSENISTDQWVTYEMLFRRAIGSILPPSLLVYLEVTPETAMRRIKKRNRPAEERITLDYLSALGESYRRLLDEIEGGRHAWSRGLQILRVAWDEDNLPIEPIVESIKHLCQAQGHVPMSVGLARPTVPLIV